MELSKQQQLEAEIEILKKSYNDVREENERLSSSVIDLEEERNDLLSDVDSLQNEVHVLETEVGDNEDTIEDLESQLENLKEIAESGTQVIEVARRSTNLDEQMKLEVFLERCKDMTSHKFEEMVNGFTKQK